MASFKYSLAMKKFATKTIDWTSDTFKCVLVDKTAGATYTPNQLTDEFLSIIPVACRISTSASLTSLTATAISGGKVACDAADVLFTAVSGTACQSIVLYKDTGSAATSPVILILESDTVAGLPYTPTGADVTLVFPNGADKIFSLG